MGFIMWDKPKRLRPKAEHDAMHSSDTEIDGTYVPNMSKEDNLRWKGKYIGGEDPRVEVRKLMYGVNPGKKGPWPHESSQVLIVVREQGIVMSANGKLVMSNETLAELWVVLDEARAELKNPQG